MVLRLALVLACCGLALSPASAQDPALVGSWGPYLHATGSQSLTADSPGFNLCKGFSIEARIRPTDLKDGRTIVYKDHQYALRIDWPNEGSRISFFVYGDGGWEPRVTAYMPVVGEWTHIVAQWDGSSSYLWVDGEPFATSRPCAPPPPNGGPLVIGSACALAAGFVGDIEYVRVRRRVLTTTEIIRASYGIAEAKGAASSRTSFDFRPSEGWHAGAGARIRRASDEVSVVCPTIRAYFAQTGLNVDVRRRDFLALRMAVDRGTRGEIVYVTSKGAGRVPFATAADGRLRSYLVEPWQWPGWGGRLLALAIVPSDRPGATARLRWLRLEDSPRAEPEVEVTDVFTESTLPRAGRLETIVARLHNAGGGCSGLTATLSVPPGVTLCGPATRALGAVAYGGRTEIRWTVRAARAMSGTFRIACTVAGGASEPPTRRSETLRFLPYMRVRPASYVPVPVPVKTGKYTIWTHYCPLWKEGTVAGWKLIEPWPNRKPVLGWYNEGDPEVADWHIKYWVEHGISGVIYCWYRSGINAPVAQSLGHAIHDGLLKARYLRMIHFGIMWENAGGQGVASRRDLMENLLPFWIKNYFSNPSYIRVDGKPVLYIYVPQYVTRDLKSHEAVRSAFNEMRAACRRKGLGGLYIVGCVGSEDLGTLQTMKEEGWDASSSYGVQWRQPARVDYVGDYICAPYEGFVKQQEEVWRFKREQNILPDITCAMMGWDSRPWKETPFFWSDNTPAKFKDLCRRVKANMDAASPGAPQNNTAIFCCWNEFGEGHYIEPNRGYGFAYLDAIRDVFSDSHGPHVDLAPADVGLAPHESWYLRARRQTPAAGRETTAWSGKTMGAWSAMMGLNGTAVRGGVLIARSNTGDPAFGGPAVRLRANRFSSVEIEMRVSHSGCAQLFWGTAATPGWSEPASVRIPTVADGQFHAYRFEVAKNDRWDGCVTGLRFDPCEESGTLIEVRSIRLIPSAQP